MADRGTDNYDIDELLQQLSDNAVAIAELREVIRRMYVREDEIVALSGGVDASGAVAARNPHIDENGRPVWAGAHLNRIAWARGFGSGASEGSPMRALSDDVLGMVGERVNQAVDPVSVSANRSFAQTLPARSARASAQRMVEPADIIRHLGYRRPNPKRADALRLLYKSLENRSSAPAPEWARTASFRRLQSTILRRLVEMGYPVREAAMALQHAGIACGSGMRRYGACGLHTATELLHIASGVEPGVTPTLAQAANTRLFGEMDSAWEAVIDEYELDVRRRAERTDAIFREETERYRASEARRRTREPEPEPERGPNRGWITRNASVLRQLVDMGYPVREAALALQQAGSRDLPGATEILRAASGVEPGDTPTPAEAAATRLIGEVDSAWEAVIVEYEHRSRRQQRHPEPDPGPGSESSSDGGSRRTRTRRITKKKKSIKKKKSRKKKRSTKRR
jgi:hypothetical protein